VNVNTLFYEYYSRVLMKPKAYTLKYYLIIS